MQCQSHNYKKVTHKCVTCKKFFCGQCSRPHIAQRHEVMTSLQLADIIKQQITQQISRMNLKISQLCILKEYESGEAVIDGCMGEILDYVKNLFQQIKNQYKKISDNCWKQENIEQIHQIQQKKNILQQWKETINKKADQATYFDAHKIYQSNKIDSDEQLIDQSQSFILNNLAPKVQFNETALRRANQSLTKIIYTQTKYKPQVPKKVIKKISSKKSLSVTNTIKKLSLCKFIQGTNILLEYVIQDLEFQQNDLTLSKTQFRQFITPLRSTGITLGSSIYLIGGYGKQNKPKKQIFLFQRAYTSMRIVGLLKQGRVGHAVCSVDENIYVFGGKMVKSLQMFNTKTKTVEIISQSKYQIIGSSMITMGNKLYIFGGTDGVEINKNVLCYNISNKMWEDVIPLNIQIFSMPISPILQGLSQYQILIYGGYFTFSGQSFNNNYMILYDTKLNYLSVYGKGQLIYPILSNGDNSVLKDNKIYCLADLKRQRHRHGPNLPVIFTYSLIEQLMQIDCMGL